LTFDPDNKWWRLHKQIVSDGVKNSQGRYLVGVPDLIEGMDTLAQLRGHNQIVLDLFKRPKWVHARLREITNLYFIYFDAIYDMIKDDVGGNAYSCYSIWGPGRTAKVQCDFSALISPSMFKKFVEPYLREQCSNLDFTLYHFDGTNALCHLDLLLKIPEITAIQWVPGAGKPLPESPKWFSIYKKILKAGKSLWLNIPINLVKKFVRTFGEKGLFIITNAKSEKEARDLIENM
jgi:5-methyltetrahydrofolate--homocysteine methyltransferase